jgi:hypothetical protein
MYRCFVSVCSPESQQVRNFTHCLTILARSPEFDIWRLQMAPLTSDLSGVSDACIGGVCGEVNDVLTEDPPAQINMVTRVIAVCSHTEISWQQYIWVCVEWPLWLYDINLDWSGWTVFCKILQYQILPKSAYVFLVCSMLTGRYKPAGM